MGHAPDRPGAEDTGLDSGLEYRRLGLGRLKNLDPPTPAIRYERNRSGELLHLDTKTLARIERVGHRVHGYRSRTVERAGWEFLHVCIDVAIRLGYAELLPTEKGQTAAGILRWSIRWFDERVMTDNGSCYRSKVFAAVLKEHGARHLRTEPYTPRTNGKAERPESTAKEGWAYARPYGHSNDRTAQLRTIPNDYNCGRPHGRIDGKTPLQRLVGL